MLAGHRKPVRHSSHAMKVAILGRPFGAEITRNLKDPLIQAEDKTRLEHLRMNAQAFGEQDRVPRFGMQMTL